MTAPRLSLPVALLGVLALAACAQTPEAAGPAPEALFERAAQHVAAHEAALIEIRHDLHRHPELSGAETRTSGVAAAHLERLGFEVQTGVGGHGVVGILRGASPGPMVAFRADMDAVRSSAPDPAETIQSLTPGVRHICGHDVHTTIGLGIAEGFAAIRDELAGSVMLVFQPAEERGTGAKAMLADGLFETDLPDAIFAVHTAPWTVGEIAVASGGMMAGRARFAVTIRGDGDLAPETSAVREALLSVGTVPPSQIREMALPGFALVQLFGGGGASGGEAVVRGQIMTAGYEDRARVKAEALAALAALDLPGATLSVDYDERFVEGIHNDAALTALLTASVAAHTPEVSVQPVPGVIPAFSEDFGSFQALTPGVMVFLGVSNPAAGTVGMPHAPDYVADDGAILVGTRALLAAMLAQLGG